MKFKVGDVVRLKADKEQVGSVILADLVFDNEKYVVFINGKKLSLFAEQVELWADENNAKIDSIEEFFSRIAAVQVLHPSNNDLYSLNAAKIDFIPHQYKPVLKIIKSDVPRILIADGVGVGKTIEAGLIIKELQARQNLKNIAIICPRPLVAEAKWQNEMKRFDEKFVHLDGAKLKNAIKECDLEGEWVSEYSKCIIPYSILDEELIFGKTESKKPFGLIHLNPPPKFDLVIVDEAHHIRNQETFAYQAVRFFCDNADAVVLLTATPIQLGNKDLFVLLNLIRPDLIIDKETFAIMSEPNAAINEAIRLIRRKDIEWNTKAKDKISEALTTNWGKRTLAKADELQNVVNLLISKGEVPDSDRVKAIQTLENLHSFAHIINRTRRRDIDKFTLRKPETVRIEFTKEQKELHDRLLSVQAEIFANVYDKIFVKFLMSTICRQASSCIFGLAPMVEEILSRHSSELFDDSDDIEWEESTVAEIKKEIESVVQLSKTLPKEDNKFDALKKIIKDKQKFENNKIILFSSFRHTLNYLYKKLEIMNVRIGLIHGGISDDERRELRKRFEMNKSCADAIDIMLFSEVGCEGLDYQFCDCMVNYDLPWNPMKIEQRIGRIDRNGQKSPTVLIYNLITQDTIDADIYDRCLSRIGVFNDAIGASEEILGNITKEIISIAQRYELTIEERREVLQQYTDNEFRKITETERMEENQYDFMSLRIPSRENEELIEKSTNFWISIEMLSNLANTYLRKRLKKESDCILGAKDKKTIRLSAEDRKTIFEDFLALEKNSSKYHKEWADYLKGDGQSLEMTFDSKYASENTVCFVSVLHPLVKQASRYFGSLQGSNIILKAKSDTLRAGLYGFSLYQWEFLGEKRNAMIVPIVENAVVSEKFIDVLKVAKLYKNQQAYAQLELSEQHIKAWQTARMEHREETNKIVDKKIESLTVSNGARLNIAKHQLLAATNEKVKIMKTREIANIEKDFLQKISSLKSAKDKADIVTTFLVGGTLIVEE